MPERAFSVRAERRPAVVPTLVVVALQTRIGNLLRDLVKALM